MSNRFNSGTNTVGTKDFVLKTEDVVIQPLPQDTIKQTKEGYFVGGTMLGENMDSSDKFGNMIVPYMKNMGDILSVSSNQQKNLIDYISNTMKSPTSNMVEMKPVDVNLNIKVVVESNANVDSRRITEAVLESMNNIDVQQTLSNTIKNIQTNNGLTRL